MLRSFRNYSLHSALSFSAFSLSSLSHLVSPIRATHVPGWQTSSSTRDVRTREQRDQDRRQRQVEKLPRPEVLHDFQYPFEKRVLCDSWFQPPVYASELDTPHLFNLYPPSDFFVYWNCADFDRTHYPAVPVVDVRTLRPGASSKNQLQQLVGKRAANKSSTDEETEDHFGSVVDLYLRKHELVPHIFPRVEHSVNLSVVFGEQEQRQGGLTRHNFWKTALMGNFMELKESHLVGRDGPAIYLQPAELTTTAGGAQQPGEDNSYYTMMILTPDFPCRAEQASEWFFLHHVVSNLKCNSSSVSTPCKGDVVVQYIPPLPTEDGGCTRVVCVLFKQKEKFAAAAAASGSSTAMPFADRINYRLHRDSEMAYSAHSASALDGNPSASNNSSSNNSALAALEKLLEPSAQSVCFFQTVWDIQVQEWYEKHELPEPRYYPMDLVELMQYNALPLDFTSVSSRHAATGAVHTEKTLEQPVKLLEKQNSSSWRMSRSTLLSKDRKYIQRPQQK